MAGATVVIQLLRLCTFSAFIAATDFCNAIGACTALNIVRQKSKQEQNNL